MRFISLVTLFLLAAPAAYADETFPAFVGSTPAATSPPASGDQVPIIQSGVTKKLTGIAPSAVIDTTNANNITSGTVAVARLPLATSSAPGIAKGDGTALSTTSGVISSNIAINLPPGATTTIGSCNATSNTISVTGTINGQLCVNSVSGTYNLVAADSGRLVKCTGAGCSAVAPNPLAATQGVTYQFIGDGTNSYTITTAGGTALFLGCPGGGGTSLAMAATASAVIDVDNSTAPVSYACMIQGVSSALATNSVQGVMKGDGTTINCAAGVCNAVNAGTTAETFLSTVSASGQTITLTGLTSTYNTYHINCTNVLVQAANDIVVGEIEIGATWESANYRVAGMYVDDVSTSTQIWTSAAAGDAFHGWNVSDTVVPSSFTIDIDKASDTTRHKLIRWKAVTTDGTVGTLYNANGASSYTGGNGAIVGFRLRNANGTNTITGTCTLSGRQ